MNIELKNVIIIELNHQFKDSCLLSNTQRESHYF